MEDIGLRINEFGLIIERYEANKAGGTTHLAVTVFTNTGDKVLNIERQHRAEVLRGNPRLDSGLQVLGLGSVTSDEISKIIRERRSISGWIILDVPLCRRYHATPNGHSQFHRRG